MCCSHPRRSCEQYNHNLDLVHTFPTSSLLSSLTIPVNHPVPILAWPQNSLFSPQTYHTQGQKFWSAQNSLFSLQTDQTQGHKFWHDLPKTLFSPQLPTTPRPSIELTHGVFGKSLYRNFICSVQSECDTFTTFSESDFEIIQL